MAVRKNRGRTKAEIAQAKEEAKVRREAREKAKRAEDAAAEQEREAYLADRIQVELFAFEYGVSKVYAKCEGPTKSVGPAIERYAKFLSKSRTIHMVGRWKNAQRSAEARIDRCFENGRELLEPWLK